MQTNPELCPLLLAETLYLGHAEDLHGVIGVEKTLLQLFPEVLDHVKGVQSLQKPLQDGNTRRHLFPERDGEKTEPLRKRTPLCHLPARKSARNEPGRRQEPPAPGEQQRGRPGPRHRAGTHRSLTLRRPKRAPRWCSPSRGRRAAGGTACRATRRARSSSRAASVRAARSSSSAAASAILAAAASAISRQSRENSSRPSQPPGGSLARAAAALSNRRAVAKGALGVRQNVNKM